MLGASPGSMNLFSARMCKGKVVFLVLGGASDLSTTLPYPPEPGSGVPSYFAVNRTSPRTSGERRSFRQDRPPSLIFDWDDTLCPTSWLRRGRLELCHSQEGRCVLKPDRCTGRKEEDVRGLILLVVYLCTPKWSKTDWCKSSPKSPKQARQ